jgi:hypothetical protein
MLTPIDADVNTSKDRSGTAVQVIQNSVDDPAISLSLFTGSRKSRNSSPLMRAACRYRAGGWRSVG